MVRAFVLFALASGCARVSTPADIQLSAVPAATFASVGASRSAPPPTMPTTSLLEIAPRVPAPPLSGLRERIDLKTLEATSVTYVLPVRLDSLARIANSDQRPVLSHLAADPRWRVTEVDGTWVATRREPLGSRWATPSHGYHLDGDEATRVALRFGHLPGSDEWSRSAFVTRATPADHEVRTQAFVLQPQPYHDMTATALTIAAPTASVDVFEARTDAEGRPATRAAVTDLDQFLDGVLRSEATVQARGYDPLSMPRGEPYVSDFVGLQVAPNGELDVYGHVNPHRAGFTWVRLVDANGRPWHEQAIANGTREWIGASQDANEHFYFQGQVPTDPGPSFEAVAEVWFAPFGGGAPEKLLASSVRVPAR